MLFSSAVLGEALDDAVAEDVFLSTVAGALAAYEIDVAHNLNARNIARGRIQQPRLGRFPDLPLNTLPSSEEINLWEADYSGGAIGGIAILTDSSATELGAEQFLDRWLHASDEARLFVTFYKEDISPAEKIASVAGAYGFTTLQFSGGDNLAVAGNLYATAAQRLAIDSRAARRYRTGVTELSFLGERVRRNSNSLFSDAGVPDDNSLARSEPSVFLKETLGDEFTQSTIREIVVPGGVALGETATLPVSIVTMSYSNGAIHLQSAEGERFALPQIEKSTLKAVFDFVQRSEAIRSDSIVDIDADGRVRISSAFRDTDPGFDIMHADTLPFKYVPNLAVTKSVIIDIGVDWFTGENKTLAFETGFEVRFLSADNMRIAQTRVALAYAYNSASESVTYHDAWGRDVPRLRNNLDYAGLGNEMAVVAHHAGWVALLRKLHEEQVPFLEGRYEFMKLDKTGRNTPSRY
ncbi:MAG: hypothetical protein O2971_18205 [Proteobacteria bacterium]|nr:hypothetical protein [Pseudomonadota bacterium]